jgi:hypothetical protein
VKRKRKQTIQAKNSEMKANTATQSHQQTTEAQNSETKARKARKANEAKQQ